MGTGADRALTPLHKQHLIGKALTDEAQSW
jgi:hypothetical protein